MIMTGQDVSDRPVSSKLRGEIGRTDLCGLRAVGAPFETWL